MSAEVANINLASERRKQPFAAPALAGWSPSKLTPPSLSAVARNGRLFDALDAALARPIVWLHGSPGAGKTTLIAGWLRERRIEPIWQRLDAEDSDPSTLFFYLGMAEARAKGGGATRRLPLLTPEYQFGTAAFSRNFFQKLFGGPRPPIVVFDDYHELDLASPIHELLANGMKEIPQGGHLVVVSRHAPPKEFARLRVNGHMEVIAPELLLLRADEASAIVQARGASLDAACLQKALDLTQGWTAGLILFLEAARSGALTDVGRAFAPDLLFDYFAGEVLRGLSEREQQTLISLSVMPSMTAAAAEQLTMNAEAGALLERLARRGYFTTRDAVEEPHFRFHPLFQQFLLEQARQTFDAGESASLKLRAARVLEECLQPEAAVPLLRDAGAWEELARLIRSWSERMMATGRHKVLTSWIGLLPPVRLEGDGWLLYWAATAAAPFSPAESHPLLRLALTIFSQSDDADGAFLAASRRVMLIITDDFADDEPLDEMIVVLRGLVARFPNFSSQFIEANVSYALHGALSRRTGERAEIAYWRGRALAAASVAGDAKLAAMVRLGAVVLALTDAKFVEAKGELAIMPSPEELNDFPYERSAARFALIIAQFYRQAPGSCVDTASVAAQEDAAAGIVFYTGLAAALASMDCMVAGDLEQARAWLDRSAAHMDRASSRQSPIYHVARAIYACATRDMTGAADAARRAIETAQEIHFRHLEAVSRLTLAQILILLGEFAEAETQLAAAEVALNRSASELLRGRLDMTRAALLLKTGRRAECLDLLRAALAEGARVGSRRLGLLRPLASVLFGEALAHDLSPEFVRLLILLESIPPPDKAAANWPWPLKIITFGGFHLFKDGAPLQLSRKTPRRLFNVLKAIATFGGKDVAQEKILDAVWPDEDGDSARRSFDIAIHRLRKLLGDADAIVVKGGKVGFDPSRCWLDTWAFETGVSARGSSPDETAASLELYGGDFLADDEDLPWTAPLRAKLRAQFVRAVDELASSFIAKCEYERAASVYRISITASPEDEPPYRGLMQCCIAMDRKAEAIETYLKLREVLTTAGLTPSTDLTAQYRALNG